MAVANGEELIRAMLMKCVVFLASTLNGSHSGHFFSLMATTRRLISRTYTIQNLRLVSCWRCKTANATLKRVPVLLFQLNKFHVP
jgi:hypothetical protein